MFCHQHLVSEGNTSLGMWWDSERIRSGYSLDCWQVPQTRCFPEDLVEICGESGWII